MAKRRKKPEPADIEELEGGNGWPTKQEYFDYWRQLLSDTWSRYKDEPPKTVRGKQAIDAKDGLLQLDLIETVNNDVMVLEATIRLGILFERMPQRANAPWIGKSPRVTQSSVKKGKETAIFTDKQSDTITAFINRKVERSVSITKACKDTADQLLTGTFRDLPGLRVECSHSTLEKRWRKRYR